MRPVSSGIGAAGIDRDLVGEGRQRGEHARAAHDDAVLGLADLVQRDVVAGPRRSPSALSITSDG